MGASSLLSSAQSMARALSPGAVIPPITAASPCHEKPQFLGAARSRPQASPHQHSRSASKNGTRKSPCWSICVCVYLHLSVSTPRKLILVSRSPLPGLHSPLCLQCVCSAVQVKNTKSVFSMVNHKGFKFTSLYLQTSNFCIHRILFHLKPSPPNCLTLERVQKKES